MADGVTARLKWLKGFERCVWSCELKLAKPDPEIFRRTAAMLRTPPGRILFIDDKEENVAAARGVDMQAIRYTTQVEFESTMLESGFSSLLEIGVAAAAGRRAGHK
jgi:putative hydrolase of the HAD superfamily